MESCKIMAKKKDGFNLVIVESPNKKATIKQFLPENYSVEASVGHITKIKDSGLYNLGIDVKGNFDIDFVVDDKKTDVVKRLKELVSRADTVYLAADPDREGEAIAYHLKEQLKIPEKKLKRITFHEITKRAVTEAIDHPGKIDYNLVDAALSRASLDKIVGYRLSPIARNKVSCRSVGRCQSPALKLIVEREEEINAFIPKTYYEIWLPFKKDKDYKAQFKGLIKDAKNKPAIEDKEFADKVIADCKGYPYVVHKIESSDRKLSPKPPFTTSTFQQEVSSKLGYSVKTAMSYAQKLFEGLNIGGQHVALVTYLRTDSTSMDPDFKETLKAFIKDNYGEDYLGKEKKEKKSKNQQDGHECFRVIDLAMTPEKLASYIYDQQLIKVYSLIYNRTIASMMSDAIINDVDFIIKNGEYKFVYSEHAVKFDGFRKVYALDDEEIVQGLDVCVGEQLDAGKLELLEKKTTPPKRYSEASLIKKLEDLGIGRPSTYATIVSTLLDPSRGYCEESGKSLAPTEKGMKLIHFMNEAFPDIVDYDYSAKMEESLDKISKGELSRVDYLRSFYSDLENQIKGAKGVEGEKSQAEIIDKVCPQCGKPLVKRNGRFGSFAACSGFPRCRYTEKIV